MPLPCKSFRAILVSAAAFALAPRAAAQSGTVTDDGFISTNSTTQQVNANGHRMVLVVAGSSSTTQSGPVGMTKTFLKFQLQPSLPPNASAPMPTARDYRAAAADAQGNIYAIGGATGTSAPALNTVEKYTPASTIYTFVKN